jgi:hypothetical protein
MPGYLLKDIGISRGEIEQAARGRHQATLNQVVGISDDPFCTSRRPENPSGMVGRRGR